MRVVCMDNVRMIYYTLARGEVESRCARQLKIFPPPATLVDSWLTIHERLFSYGVIAVYITNTLAACCIAAAR